MFGRQVGTVAAVVIAGAVLALSAPAARAQADTVGGPAVGEMAPDFSLPGATRYGLLGTPVRLSDYRGKTVVLAFFYQSRTKG
jgi:cytochrome oxidase Cu insertion factor (SCO1/SenC/PrrC family)